MRGIAISVAFTAMGLLGTVAEADSLNGAPVRNGNQCFTLTPKISAPGDSRFGYWGACPEPAAVTPAPKARKRRAASR
jgi:hypothetical protein